MNQRQDTEQREKTNETISPTLVLHSKEDLAQFWDKFKRHHGLRDSSHPKIREKIDARQVETLEQAVKEGRAICLGVKAEKQLVGIIKVDLKIDSEGQKYAYLGSLNVDHPYRGKEKNGVKYRDEHGKEKPLAQQLVERAVRQSRENGCASVMAEVLSDNPDGPRSIGTLLKSGLRLERFELYEQGLEGTFILQKKFSEPDEDKQQTSSEEKRVEFTDRETMIGLLQTGWRGTQVLQGGGKFYLVLEK